MTTTPPPGQPPVLTVLELMRLEELRAEVASGKFGDGVAFLLDLVDRYGRGEIQLVHELAALKLTPTPSPSDSALLGEVVAVLRWYAKRFSASWLVEMGSKVVPLEMAAAEVLLARYDATKETR